MKKNILFITLFTTYISFSQITNYKNGEIFFRDGTSEKGLIKRKLYTIKFKNASTKLIELDYKKIKRIIIKEDGEENEYQYKIIKGKKKGGIKLLELVKKGNISIYRTKFVDVAGSITYKGATYYLCKNNSDSVTFIGSNSISIGRKSIKKGLIKYFSDCKSLVKKLKNNDFKNKDIIEAVDYYINKCS